MAELSKRIYFGGPYAKKRWANWKKIAKDKYRGSMSSMIRDAISRMNHLDPETGEPLLDATEKKEESKG